MVLNVSFGFKNPALYINQMGKTVTVVLGKVACSNYSEDVYYG